MVLSRRFPLPESYDLMASLSTVRGPGGDTSRRRHGALWRATRNGSGSVTISIRREGSSALAEAWGEGASEELETVPRLLGLDDDPAEFRPPSGPIAELARRSRGVYLGSTGRIFEAVAPTVLGQRVTTVEAHRGYRSLVSAYGEPAPGPERLRLPPSPARLAELTYEDLHRHGIERTRAAVLIEAARRASRVEEAATMACSDAYSRLTAVRGIGVWTAGNVMGFAWGDRDAVPVGDFHLPNIVAWVLAGEPRGDDERMLELLEPFRPYRRRALMLLRRSGAAAPRYGPRAPIHDMRSH